MMKQDGRLMIHADVTFFPRVTTAQSKEMMRADSLISANAPVTHLARHEVCRNKGQYPRMYAFEHFNRHGFREKN